MTKFRNFRKASSQVFFSLRMSVLILGAPSVTLQPGTLDSWPTLRFPHDRSQEYKLDGYNPEIKWTNKSYLSNTICTLDTSLTT